MTEKPVLLTFTVHLKSGEKFIVRDVLAYCRDGDGLSLNAGEVWHFFCADTLSHFVAAPPKKK